MLLELAIVIQTAGHVNDATALTVAQELLKNFTIVPKEQNFRVVSKEKTFRVVDQGQDRIVVKTKVNVPSWYWGY